jgi:hypothetical protein
MSNTHLEAELKQFRTKLDLLLKEGQALFLRHSDTAPHAAKAVMPHLQVALTGVDTALDTPMKKSVEKPARLMESGD